jgi:hypothetical protein
MYGIIPCKGCKGSKEMNGIIPCKGSKEMNGIIPCKGSKEYQTR